MEEDFEEEIMYIEYLENIPRDHVVLRRNNDFYLMDDKNFKSRYRLSKEVVIKILEEVEGRLEFTSNRNNPLQPVQQLLLALRFYATGSFHIVTGDLVGISKATVCRSIRKVSEAIALLAPKYIQFPNEAERRQVMMGFHRIAQFPRVVGAIDCTHIPILSPGGENGEVFRNRKGYFSINVQTICDSDLVIRNIVARWPGSTHDSYIFDNSEVRMKFETGQIKDCHLLGDNGYRLSNYLLTPILNPRNASEENFNKSHIRTRNSVERQYGVWKRRFPSLKFGLRTKLQSSLAIIVSTAVLHNIAIVTRDEEPPPEIELLHYFHIQRERHNEPVQPPPLDDVQGPPAAYRQRIVQTHFF